MSKPLLWSILISAVAATLAVPSTADGIVVGINIDVHQDIQGLIVPNDFHIRARVCSHGRTPVLLDHVDDVFQTFQITIVEDLSGEECWYVVHAHWGGTPIPWCTELHLGIFLDVESENIMVDLIGWWTFNGEPIQQGQNHGFVLVPGFEVQDFIGGPQPMPAFMRLINGDLKPLPAPGEIEGQVVQMDLFPVPAGQLEALLGPEPFKELRRDGLQEGLDWIPVGRDTPWGFVPISSTLPEPFAVDSFFDVFLDVFMPNQLRPERPIMIEPGGFLLARERIAFQDNSGEWDVRWFWEIHGAIGDQPQACCFRDGMCKDLRTQECLDQDGLPMGPMTSCENTICPIREACCLPNGSCVETDPQNCLAMKGVHQGPGKACADVDCAQACCLPDGNCQMTDPVSCLQMQGTPQGSETDCANIDCPKPPEACCLPDGSCEDLPPDVCRERQGEPMGTGTDCTNVICEQPCPEALLEFSLDIGSDKELSDPSSDGDEGFDPGDVYFAHWPPVTPPVVAGGRDGEKDDQSIFGFDPRPDPPDAARPPATRVPVGSNCLPEVCYKDYFDLDGHDQIDINLQQWIPPDEPLSAPIQQWWIPLPHRCVWPLRHLAISYDDDQPPGWPVMDVPVMKPSAAGAIYGNTGTRDEVIGVSLLPLAPPMFQVGLMYPVADEIDVHRDLCHNPDGVEAEDDDVDSLDMIPFEPMAPGRPCPHWLFTVDHEASLGLDPGSIYVHSPGGPGVVPPVKVIDQMIHLGLRDNPLTAILEDADVRDFEITWAPLPQGPAVPVLAIVFAVAPDDPLTPGVDESGGLNPQMIHLSYLMGSSSPLLQQPLMDNIDGLAVWCQEISPPVDPVPPRLVSAVSRKQHGPRGWFDIPLPVHPPAGAGIECRLKGPTTLVLTFSEPVAAADGILDATEIMVSHGLVTSVTLNCNDLTVLLTNVPNRVCLQVKLAGIVDLAWNPLAGDDDLHVVCLEGDVNGDRQVASGDITQVKAVSGHPTDPFNFRRDVNADGIIASGDITIVKARSGHHASCP
ncbi:MAG: hypothetical protein AMXMBFR13_23230 [Phycisphaerae bacterium]